MTSNSVADLILSEQKPYNFYLDDAVSVIRNVTVTSNDQSQMLNMKQVQNLINENVQKTLLFVTRSMGMVPTQDRGFKTKGNGSKKNSNCDKKSKKS